jgi:hypothetical protein
MATAAEGERDRQGQREEPQEERCVAVLFGWRGRIRCVYCTCDGWIYE